MAELQSPCRDLFGIGLVTPTCFESLTMLPFLTFVYRKGKGLPELRSIQFLVWTWPAAARFPAVFHRILNRDLNPPVVPHQEKRQQAQHLVAHGTAQMELVAVAVPAVAAAKLIMLARCFEAISAMPASAADSVPGEVTAILEGAFTCFDNICYRH